MLNRIKALVGGGSSSGKEGAPTPVPAHPVEGPPAIRDVLLCSCIKRPQDRVWRSGFVRDVDHRLFITRRANDLFGQIDEPLPELPEAQRLPRAYFGGVLFPYYGHFLLESLARLPHIPDDGLPIVFMCLDNTVKPWHSSFFEDIGLAPRLRFTRKDRLLRVDELIRVDQTSTIHADIGLAFVRHTQRLFAPTPSCGRRIYLSRRGVSNAPVAGEDALEAGLQALGVEIVTPETLSIREQVQVLNEADWVIGIEGSALHNLIFCASPKQVLVLPRRRALDHNFVLQFAVQAHLQVQVLHAMSRYGDTFSAPSELDVPRALSAIEAALARR